MLPPLGLLTVAALLPRSWECRLADLNSRPLTAADWRWADLVMLTGMLIQRDGLLALLREAKQKGKTVVVGGPYATSLPQEVLDAGADFLFRGECEDTMPLFLSALEAGQTRGIFQPEERPDLGRSPIPRFEMLNLDDYITMGIQTSRGCPFNCEFCDVINLFGRKPRFKPARQVLDEVETLFRLGWRGDILISDDNFIGSREHARALLDLLTPWMKRREEPFCFWTQTSLNLGQDLEMIDLMTAANFGHVFIGVETPDGEVLTRTRKYQNIKHDPVQSLNNIRNNGLSLIGSFILGFDGEKKGAGDRICDFVEQTAIPAVMLNILQAPPNTDLWDRLQREGRLLPDKTSGDFLGERLNYLPTRPEAEIMQEYLRMVARLYEPSGYLSRAYRYYRAMRPTRAALARRQGEREPDPARKKARPPWRTTLRDLRALLKLIWRQGILPHYRFQFWKQLWGMYRHNPSRLKTYLLCCAMGENLFWLRQEIFRKAATAAPEPRA